MPSPAGPSGPFSPAPCPSSFLSVPAPPRPPSRSTSSRATTSASSATPSPTGCSTTAGSKPTCTPASRSTTWSIRNLGFSGDEVDRPRACGRANFGTPRPVADTKVKADVVFAFFGYNESFAGEAGLPKFKTDLDAFIKHTLGRSTTASRRRGWCCSRRSRTRTSSRPNLPDGEENNKRLDLYTDGDGRGREGQRRPVRRSVHADEGGSTRRPNEPLTINGVHLNEEGNELARGGSSTARCSPATRAADARRHARRRSAGRCRTRTSTGSSATARPTATRPTAAGPT